MYRQTTALATALLLSLSAPLWAQETATEDAPAEATTEAPAEAPATEAPAEAPSEATDAAPAEAPADSADAAPAAEMATPDADMVVATVGDSEITLGQMIIARSQLPPQYQQLPPDVLFNGVLEQLIQQQVLSDTLETEPARVGVALENQRRSLRAGEVVNGIVEGVSDEDVRAAYDTQFASMEPAQEFNASHILVATEEEAQAVEERLAAGEDFAALAQELSTDPGSGTNGGQLGWFGPGMMVEPFQAAVETMEAGAVSEPVQTQFGWHIIKLNETRDQEPPAFEEVQGDLAQQVQQEAIEARLAELMEQAEVTRPGEGTIDPAVLGDLTLLDE